MKKWIVCAAVLIFYSCSGMQTTEKSQVLEKNAQEEFIYRKADECVYRIPKIERRIREKYPWEETAERK